ncbi:hybrid sensor histidine kinase/response regulator [Roseofilum casamattae]|uniref:histidine kinase n=1 Tax=Roseofilum casamattae BLCC-M143 TaxID=3022442 RepID=A0ABT7C1C0_9CYAN|nr:ATP-binding protein [Roseofilum casamattae]MDJ1185236.1 ATP-binding protein [Roseofilum casamattae BLCC-M143]
MGAIEKILIVEDELIAAYNLADNIERLGYEVSGIVKTGEAALAKVSDNPPNLILMDIKLQGEMSGIETARALQEYEIPIIYLTAFNDTATLAEAVETYAYGYLNKPAKLEDIRSAISLSLSKHQRDRTIESILTQEQQLNQMKSRFVAMVAHDLRAPLTHMLVSLEILRKYGDELNPDQKEKQFNQMQIAIKNMTLQLEEMMTIDRVESGNFVLKPQVIDLVRFCEERLDFFDTVARHNYNLVFKHEGQCSCLCLDEDILQHVLNNLISNAIKYSPKGGDIRLHLVCKDRKVVLEISDRGIGIPPEELEKLYQPFERASNVGNIKGTGIGMYIVKRAIECHHGQIAVSSEVGVGTTFKISLPYLQPEQ